MNIEKQFLNLEKNLEKKEMSKTYQPEQAEQEQKDRKAYRGQRIINGIDIRVGWDRGYDDYTIYFPQIELGEEDSPPDQVIRITRRPEVAKQVFDFAVEKSKEINDVNKLYRAVEKFARTLQYDDEE